MPSKKRTAKRSKKAKPVKRRVAQLKTESKPKRSPTTAKPGPRLDDEQKVLLLALLAAGEPQSAINGFFAGCGWGKLSPSTLAHYRKLWAGQIAEAKAARISDALTTGMALRSERVAKLKLHAEQLSAMRWNTDARGRLWTERAWRQTLADIAAELGERRPQREGGDGEIVKIYVGVDADRV